MISRMMRIRTSTPPPMYILSLLSSESWFLIPLLEQNTLAGDDPLVAGELRRRAGQSIAPGSADGLRGRRQPGARATELTHRASPTVGRRHACPRRPRPRHPRPTPNAKATMNQRAGYGSLTLSPPLI